MPQSTWSTSSSPRRLLRFDYATVQHHNQYGPADLERALVLRPFEREVIGERVRDKIAASKRKGLWMGGLPPLGFDVEDRCLIVNAAEAEIVVDVFQRYLRLKSVRALEAELAVAGILSKRRIRADGSTYGGKALSRGALYLMLQNRLYRGEVAYKGAIYAGAHAAIVDEPQWTDVQTLLAINRVGHASGARASHPSLLGGFVFDRNGARLTPSHAVKAGVRYRYYVSRALVVGHARNCRDGWRIPAGDLERGVVGRLRALLTDPGALMDAIGDDEANATNLDEIIQRARKIARDLSDAEPQRIKETFAALACRVEVSAGSLKIVLPRHRLVALLAARGEYEIAGRTDEFPFLKRLGDQRWKGTERSPDTDFGAPITL